MVLMDVAAEYAGWNSDLTRTVPVNGRGNSSKTARQCGCQRGHFIGIGQPGGEESLNVAAAAAICLHASSLKLA